jgi:lipid-A-disaccharide synthase
MTASRPVAAAPLRVALVAGESSGDHLGARLMTALRELADAPVSFFGVGGPAMEAEGIESLFPLSETALMGPFAILVRLPRLIGLVRRTVDEVIAFRPDVLVIIDSPEFTHAVARRIRRRAPGIPIVNYVSPTVWAWRSWRARSMRAYVDHVAAIFPFEPEVHQQLGGPPCTYVGHPLVEGDCALSRRSTPDRQARPVLLLLPGSRETEVRRLLPVFEATINRLADHGHDFDAVLPAVDHLAGDIARAVAAWRSPPEVVVGEQEKRAAFAKALVALAASGTVTLELALAQVPMVVAYRLDPLTARLKWILRLPSVVMANLVLGENAFPEFIHHDCTPDRLADALAPLFGDTSQRAAQLAAAERVIATTRIEGEAPSRRAARIVLQAAARSA